MYFRRKHMLFHGFAGFFSLIFAVILGGLVFRAGMTRGLILAGGGVEQISSNGLDINRLFVIFGGILVIMILTFIFRLVYWRLIGKERMEYFVEHAKDMPHYVPGRHFRHHPCYAPYFRGPWYPWDDEEGGRPASEKTSSEDKKQE